MRMMTTNTTMHDAARRRMRRRMRPDAAPPPVPNHHPRRTRKHLVEEIARASRTHGRIPRGRRDDVLLGSREGQRDEVRFERRDESTREGGSVVVVVAARRVGIAVLLRPRIDEGARSRYHRSNPGTERSKHPFPHPVLRGAFPRRYSHLSKPGEDVAFHPLIGIVLLRFGTLLRSAMIATGHFAPDESIADIPTRLGFVRRQLREFGSILQRVMGHVMLLPVEIGNVDVVVVSSSPLLQQEVRAFRGRAHEPIVVPST
mmetsp:Transcript_8699/g.18373  ORF Transcript_8699/g.18373 Transcript_8699/m.18373 type:complete len:259 (-) Transcript_8699:26-802(-)